MTVRKKTWTNRDNTTSEAWEVDIHYRHPDGRAQRVRRIAPGTSKREALAFERQLLASLVSGTYNTHNPADTPTLSEFAVEWMRDYVEVNCKPTTQRTRRSALRSRIEPELGALRLDAIGRRDIARWKSSMMRDGLKPKTINNHLGVLSALLSTAVEWEVLERVPKIVWLDVPKPDVDFLDFDESDRVVESCEERWRPLLITALKTGMRLGELAALRHGDVDLVRGQLRVIRAATRGIVSTPKGGRSRTIPMSDGLVEVLTAHMRRSKLRGELVFSTDAGEILTRDRVKRVIPRACRLAGLREVGWHVMRHTFASHLAMQGVPLKVIQELLGHATLEMTMRYAHLAPDVGRQAVALLDTRDGFDSGVRGEDTEKRKGQPSN